MDILEINKIKEENRLLNEQEIKERKIILKSKPQTLLLITDNICNLKCIMCGEVTSQRYKVANSLFNSVINNMKYLYEFTCQGGEPLLFDRFDILVQEAKKNNTFFRFTTNALLLNKQQIYKFKNMNVAIHISIDGFDKQTYESIRINGSFDVLKGNLKVLKELKEQEEFKNIKYILFMVVMNKNYNKIKDCLSFALEYGFDSIRLLKLNGDNVKQYLPNLEETNVVYNQISECLKRIKKENLQICLDIDPALGYKKVYDNIPSHTNNNVSCTTKNVLHNIICKQAFRTLLISRDSYVSLDCLCNIMPKYKVETIEQGWNSVYLQQIRKGLIENIPFDMCKRCYENNLFKQ